MEVFISMSTWTCKHIHLSWRCFHLSSCISFRAFPPLSARLCLCYDKKNKAKCGPAHDYSYGELSLIISGQNVMLLSPSLMVHPHAVQVPLFMRSELTNSPENTKYWFLHLHKAGGLLLRKLCEWKMKYAAWLRVVASLMGYVYFLGIWFVALRLRKRRNVGVIRVG